MIIIVSNIMNNNLKKRFEEETKKAHMLQFL